MSDSSREPFEQALKDIGYTPSRFETNKNGVYIEHVVNEAWCSWQLAKQSMQGEAIEVVRVENLQQFRVMPNGAWMWCCTDDCIETINTHAPNSAKTIAELQAENEALRKDAELGKLVRQKMTSGNDVPVSRCTITAAEIDAAIKGGE